MGFASSEVAGACVADIIRAGVLPVAIEFMDRPCIRACEAFAHAGYPDVRGAADRRGRGIGGGDRRAARARSSRWRGGTIRRCCARAGRRRRAALIWKGRKSAFGAMGQIADYICLDGTIPVGELPVRAEADRRADGGLRARRGQRLPCRRRQHAPADPLRRQRARASSTRPRRWGRTSCGSASRWAGA